MIDPQIALSVRPVQAENPLETFARVSSLRGQQQQQQMNALALLASKRQMQEEDAVRNALTAAGGDIGKALPAIMQASPKSGIGLSKSIAEQRAAALQQQKAELDIHDRNFKRLGSMAAAVNTPEDLNRFLSEGVNLKVLDPQTAQQIAAQGLTTGTMQWLDARTKEAMTLTEQLAQKRFELDAEMRKASNAREAEKAQREATMFPVERQKAEAEAALEALKAKGEEPIQPGERERITATKTAAERAAAEFEERKRHNKAMEAKPTGGVGAVPNQSTPAQQKLTGDDFLKTLPPARANLIRQMANGSIPAPSPNSRSGAAQQNLNDLMQYDPTFSAQRAQVRKAFTTGKEGQNIGALNTAIVHLGRLGEAAEALKNKSFTPGNEAYNYIRDKFGANVVTNFELLKDAVAGEMAAALKGTATDIEIANMKRSIRASNSPEQMRGVVTEGMAVLKDKANTYDERYHREMPDDPWSPILPSAKDMLARHGVGKQESKPGTAKVKVWNPKTNRFE